MGRGEGSRVIDPVRLVSRINQSIINNSEEIRLNVLFIFVLVGLYFDKQLTGCIVIVRFP